MNGYRRYAATSAYVIIIFMLLILLSWLNIDARYADVITGLRDIYIVYAAFTLPFSAAAMLLPAAMPLLPPDIILPLPLREHTAPPLSRIRLLLRYIYATLDAISQRAYAAALFADAFDATPPLMPRC